MLLIVIFATGKGFEFSSSEEEEKDEVAVEIYGDPPLVDSELMRYNFFNAQRVYMSSENLVEDGVLTRGFFQLLFEKVKHITINSRSGKIRGNLRSIGPEAFQNFPNLIHLEVLFEHVEELHKDSLISNKKLRKISFKDNEISTLPETLLKYSPDLKEIDFSFNRIEVIPNNFFKSLANLSRVDFKQNRLMKFEKNWLNMCRLLKKIDFSDNQIRVETMETDAFGDPGGIEYLNFAHNEIQAIDVEFFNGFENLEYLNFESNEIGIVHKEWFRNFIILNYINFKDNKINVLEKGHIYMQSNSSGQQIFLDLSENLIQLVESKIFDEFRIFRKIDLSGNEIQQIPENFMRNVSAAYIDLSRNEISSIGKEAFSLRGQVQVQVLDLSWNEIDLLDSGWFGAEDQKIYSDLILNLNNNVIKVVPENFFQNFHPATINLADNQIEKITTSFDWVSSIDLKNNKIKSISPDSFAKIGYRMIRIDLQNNVCFNEMLDMKEVWNGKMVRYCSEVCEDECFNIKMISIWN